MELVVTSQDLEPLPISRTEAENTRPIGLLNSSYKNIAKHNFTHSNLNSIFGIRQRIKSRRYQITLEIDAILKLSVFLIVLAVIF